MSKNGPTTVRHGYSRADAVASKVPIVPTRTSAQMNLANYLARFPHLRDLVEAKQAKGKSAAKIVDWLKDNGHCGTFRLKAWLDREKTKLAETRYDFDRDKLQEAAETSFAQGLYRHARLAEFRPKSATWKKIERWPAKRTKKRK
jgi:hypothetical protein